MELCFNCVLNLWCFSIHTVICEINGVLWHFAELCVIHCEDLNASVCFLHLTSPRCMELFLELFYRVYVIVTNLVQTLGCIELFPGYVTFFSWSLRNYYSF